ncbi:transaldolase [Kribbella orskensis]|uniref:Transaldolase n=1 Tax=Kribbella orskensis TaxID=2512216 RepID=A0ABY2BC43_9ACTN|nr:MULTISPECIES: transaldolase [Kribbella]TCN32916.1 transaldolase [Kribbella sp. VKM Ac-2500]TCO13210.1 transaldolase [Kribbella orskensis]
MTKLEHLYGYYGQSPWLDNLTRAYLSDGTLGRMVANGIRGVTANPSIFARSISGSHEYDEQFAALMAAGKSVDEAYWEMVISDAGQALTVLRPVFDGGDCIDGFVSVEVSPELAHDAPATIAAARWLRRRMDQPNLLVKIPATAEGVTAVETLTAEGSSINVTLLFSLTRYAEIIEAYLCGLERFSANGGDPSTVSSVASFFVSRVDTEVDHRLESLGTDEALALRGQAAVAQAKLAYRLFAEQFCTERWHRLASLGADLQRPLWASTSTKNPHDRDTRYVEELIGPDTVTTLPEATIAAFEDHGTMARTVDTGVPQAAELMLRLAAVGVDMTAVGRTLEDNGIASFNKAYHDVLANLAATKQPPAPAR